MALPNYDYDTENSQLDRRQKLMEALMSGGLAPMGETPQIGGVAGVRSPMEGVAKLMQAYLGAKGVKSVGEERAQLTNRYKADGRAGLERLLDGLSAQPGAVPAQGLPDGGQGANNPSAYVGPTMQTAQDVAGKKRAAILEAMGSNHPMLQQIGGAQLQQMLKAKEPTLTPKDVFDKANPGSQEALARAAGIADFKAQKGKPIEVGGMLVSPEDYTVIKVQGDSPSRIEFKGDLYEQNSSTGQWKKLDNATKITNTVNMPKGESEFDKQFGGAQGKALSEAMTQRPAQLDGLKAIESGKALLDQGIHTGITANLSKGADKVLATLAKTDAAKAARTEQFIAYIGDIVIPRLKDFGGSDTVEELKYLQKVQGGDVTMEAAALKRVLQSAEAKMRRKIETTDRTIEAYKGRGLGLPSTDSGVQSPVPPPAGAPKPMVKDW